MSEAEDSNEPAQEHAPTRDGGVLDDAEAGAIIQEALQDHNVFADALENFARSNDFRETMRNNRSIDLRCFFDTRLDSM